MWSAVLVRSIMRAIASGPSRILGPEQNIMVAANPSIITDSKSASFWGNIVFTTRPRI